MKRVNSIIKGDDWHFVETGHGQDIISNAKKYLLMRIVSLSVSKGVETWLHKHIDYAFSEVQVMREEILSISWIQIRLFHLLLYSRSGWKDGYNGLYTLG